MLHRYSWEARISVMGRHTTEAAFPASAAVVSLISLFVRTFSATVRETVVTRLKVLLDGVTAGFGARYTLEITDVTRAVINDGAWHDIRVNMSNNPNWQGTITRLRVDPIGNGNADGSYDGIGIDFCRLAEAFGASLHVLHVLEDLAAHAWTTEVYVAALPGVHEEMERQARERLEALLTAAERERYHATLVLRSGSPFVEVVRYSRDEQADMMLAKLVLILSNHVGDRAVLSDAVALARDSTLSTPA